jgi:hypothetical protein
LYEAADMRDLVDNFGLILREEMFESFVDELVLVGRESLFVDIRGHSLLIDLYP